ncbi:MAG TPA: hypothetical protein VFV39_02900 [Limnobacter sp.]|nr:hypothetical protein [Limnobacter sp.]
MNAKVSPTGPFHSELAQRLNHVEGIKRTGPLKWGITRFRMSDPLRNTQGSAARGQLWFSAPISKSPNTHINGTKVKDCLALARAFAAPEQPPDRLTCDNADRVCQLVIQTVLNDESHASGLSADLIYKAVQHFDLLQHVRNVHAETADDLTRLRSLTNN